MDDGAKCAQKRGRQSDGSGRRRREAAVLHTMARREALARALATLRLPHEKADAREVLTSAAALAFATALSACNSPCACEQALPGGYGGGVPWQSDLSRHAPPARRARTTHAMRSLVHTNGSPESKSTKPHCKRARAAQGKKVTAQVGISECLNCKIWYENQTRGCVAWPVRGSPHLHAGADMQADREALRALAFGRTAADAVPVSG